MGNSEEPKHTADRDDVRLSATVIVWQVRAGSGHVFIRLADATKPSSSICSGAKKESHCRNEMVAVAFEL